MDKGLIDVLPPNDLKDYFLRLLQQWSHETLETCQQLLVIILAHGLPSEDNYDICLGGRGELIPRSLSED